MNFEAIETFVDTVAKGSFAAVARGRGVAPSSISRVIGELETDLELRLFQRTTRRLSLTEAGRAYFDRIAPLIEELAHARDFARGLGSAPRGVLRVAVTSTFAQMHVSRWLPGFLALYPDLAVELALDASYTNLISDRIDVAIRLGHVESTTSIAKRLCAMPRVIVASPARQAGRRTIKPSSFETEPCLLFPHEGFRPIWKLRDRTSAVVEVSPRGRVVAADGVLLRALALAGEGFALLPRWLCAEQLVSGELVDACPAMTSPPPSSTRRSRSSIHRGTSYR